MLFRFLFVHVLSSLRIACDGAERCHECHAECEIDHLIFFAVPRDNPFLPSPLLCRVLIILIARQRPPDLHSTQKNSGPKSDCLTVGDEEATVLI